MISLYKAFKFFHSLFYIYCQIRRYIIIIFYSIRRTCSPFYYIGIIESYSILCIICHRCVFYYSRIPYMSYCHFLQFLQGFIRYIIKFSYTVFFFCSVIFICCIFISEKSCHHLIYHYFVIFYIFFCKIIIFCKIIFYFFFFLFFNFYHFYIRSIVYIYCIVGIKFFRFNRNNYTRVVITFIYIVSFSPLFFYYKCCVTFKR
ncbi:MAG: hypothetical protein BWY64_03517 [bacterium ADurb.Bin363]|nr:MAG: hypothetical protein BWY64_03517 [bacterium ADurb.Bin363]